MSKLFLKINVLLKSIFTGTFKFEVRKMRRTQDSNKFLPIIDQKYRSLFEHYSQKQRVISNFDKNIFMYWHTGFDNSNELAKKCVDNIKKIYEPQGYKIYLLDYASIKKNVYFNFDSDFISMYEKKRISVQHLSDLIRITAIHELGGVWMDASLFILSFIDFESLVQNNTFNSISPDYFIRKYGDVEYNWSTFLLFGTKCNVFCEYLIDIAKDFFKTNKKIPYVLTDMLICLGKKYNIDNINNSDFGSYKSKFNYVVNLPIDEFERIENAQLINFIKSNPQKLNFSMLKSNEGKKKLLRLLNFNC